MAKRWRVAGGVAAIWDGATDTLPFTDPDGHADRVLFTTKWNYTRIIDRRVMSVTFPAYTKSSSKSDFLTSQNLFAHGIAGEPRVRGNITVGGQKLSLGCQVPIQTFPGGNGFLATTAVFRLAIIGATSTHVVMTDFCTMSGFDNGTVMPAITFSITVEVTNELN